MTTSVLKMQRELVAVTEERDRLAAELQKLREQKPVVQYMARRLTPEATKEMWGYVLVDGLQHGAMLYAAPVAAPAVLVDDASHDGLSVQAYHEWIRCALRLPDAAPMRFDFYAQEIERRLAVPAPSVPEEWLEVMAGLVAIAEKKGKKHGSPNHCHKRPGIWDDDNGPVFSGKPCAECAMYDRARALRQSAEVTK